MFLKRNNLAVLGLITACFMFSAVAQGADTGRDEPIKIYARQIELNHRNETGIYRGDVSLTQGDLQIRADMAKVRMNKGSIQTVLAHGTPVTLHQRPENGKPEVHVAARRLEYDVPSGKLVLYGKVVLRQRGSEFHSETLRYDLNTRYFVAEGDGEGERVFALIQPQPETPHKNAPAGEGEL